jgi:hypothetical protein
MNIIYNNASQRKFSRRRINEGKAEKTKEGKPSILNQNSS